jgi:WD40 repeat protein
MKRREGLIILAASLAIPIFAGTATAQEARKLATLATSAKIRDVSTCGTTGLVAGLGRGGSVEIWRLPAGQAISNWKAGADATSLACSPDGKSMAIGKGDGTVVIADASGKPSKTLAVARTAVEGVMFAPDGSLLAVRVHERPAQLWNPQTGSRVAELETDFSGSTGMAFSRDSSTFATSDADTRVRVYDRNGKLKSKYEGLALEPFAIDLLPDGKRLVVGGADCTLTLLDVANGHVVHQLPKVSDPVFAAAALPDGHSVLSLEIDAATLGKYTVVVWNLDTNQPHELAIDGKSLVGYGEIAGQRPALFTADSDSSLTAWEITR